MKKFYLRHSKKKKMFECSWQKGKKKEYVEKNVQKKNTTLIQKKKKKHVQKQKRKKISQHWKPLDLCHPGDYVPICNSTQNDTKNANDTLKRCDGGRKKWKY